MYTKHKELVWFLVSTLDPEGDIYGIHLFGHFKHAGNSESCYYLKLQILLWQARTYLRRTTEWSSEQFIHHSLHLWVRCGVGGGTWGVRRRGTRRQARGEDDDRWGSEAWWRCRGPPPAARRRRQAENVGDGNPNQIPCSRGAWLRAAFPALSTLDFFFFWRLHYWKYALNLFES
jgi:hypothetical protein